jgi:D-arabinose 1-dehydrogenase-like Zn-dependent alcohol dehydrogenase
MKAAVVSALGAPLEVLDCAIPEPGRETLREQQQNSGYSVDGAFAEYVVASSHFVVPVHDEITSMDAGVLSGKVLARLVFEY